MLLERLPIDIVEIVIMKSDEYGLFKELRVFLPKLLEPRRIARINDKLTKVELWNDSIIYILDGDYHREYNKPNVIYCENDGFNGILYQYKSNAICKRNDGFSRISKYYRDRDCGYDNYNNQNSQELVINPKYVYYNIKLNKIIQRGFEYF